MTLVKNYLSINGKNLLGKQNLEYIVNWISKFGNILFFQWYAAEAYESVCLVGSDLLKRKLITPLGDLYEIPGEQNWTTILVKASLSCDKIG